MRAWEGRGPQVWVRAPGTTRAHARKDIDPGALECGELLDSFEPAPGCAPRCSRCLAIRRVVTRRPGSAPPPPAPKRPRALPPGELERLEAITAAVEQLANVRCDEPDICAPCWARTVVGGGDLPSPCSWVSR